MLVDASSAEAIDLLKRAAGTFRGVDNGVDAFALVDVALAFVAVDDDEIVGWCWGYFLPRPDGTAMAYIHELEVADGHRQRGIGRDLMQAFAHAADQRGASKMFLTTGEANAAARALYDSLGGGLAEQAPTVNYWFRLPLA